MRNFTTIKNVLACSFLMMSGVAMAQTNLISNGDFEKWDAGKAVDWASTNTASSGAVSQSDKFHGGAASVMLKGATSNKRLASKEYALQAGTYEYSVFVKAANDTLLARVAAGNTTIDKFNNLRYDYAQEVDSIGAEWVKLTHTFTLTEPMEVNLVVNNKGAKKVAGNDILIDDAVLTTTDGGIVEGGIVIPQTPAEKLVAKFSFETEADNKFVVKDVTVDPALTAVWTWDAKYKTMTASGYASKACHPAESYLVSPVIDLTNEKDVYLQFTHKLNSLKGGVAAEHAKLLVSADYADDVTTATWDTLTIATYPSGSDFYVVEGGPVDLTQYAGKKINIAFVYISTAKCAPKWEIVAGEVVRGALTGIESVEADVNAPVEVYNLSGVKVGSSLNGLKSGIYLVKKGNSVKKVLK